jgi:methylated-DNA-[protein]-cysteine S-methyltransferase
VTGRFLEQAEREGAEYFDGGRTSFDVDLHLSGTPFQLEIWRRPTEIPYGSARTYEELARLADRPGAQRAVGRANWG